MPSFLLNLFSFNEQQEEIAARLKAENLRSLRVVGRGTILADAREIRSSQKFKDYAQRASGLVSPD